MNATTSTISGHGIHVFGTTTGRDKPAYYDSLATTRLRLALDVRCAVYHPILRPSSKMANNFYNLPPELQIHILSELDAVSLIRCAMVRLRRFDISRRGLNFQDHIQMCKSIYVVVKSSSLLLFSCTSTASNMLHHQ